jgi:hypothetical protein
MSFPFGAIAGAAAGAAAARQAREEEKMAGYNTNDLDGWEFKIVRSALGRFSSRQAIEKVRQEEAQNGWELLEKFDDHRLRFKRRVERRSGGSVSNVDPYRSSVGFGGPRVGLIVGLLTLLAGVALLFFMQAGGSGSLHLPGPTIAVLVVAILLPVVGLVVWRARR